MFGVSRYHIVSSLSSVVSAVLTGLDNLLVVLDRLWKRNVSN